MKTLQMLHRSFPGIPMHAFDPAITFVPASRFGQSASTMHYENIVLQPTVMYEDEPVVTVHFPCQKEARFEIMLTDINGALLFFTNEIHEGPIDVLYVKLDAILPGVGKYIMAVSVNGWTRMEMLNVISGHAMCVA